MARVFLKWRQASKIFHTILLVGGVILASSLGGETADIRAEGDSPYHVAEFPIKVAPNNQTDAVISGKWVIWRNPNYDPNHLSVHNLDTGVDSLITTGNILYNSINASDDIVVTSEINPDTSEYGIFGYRIPDGQRFTIAPFKGGGTFYRSTPSIRGNTVVWAEGTRNSLDIYGCDLVTQRLFPVSTNSAQQEYPAVSGNFVIWLDNRNTPPGAVERDICGYDLSAGQEFRVTSRPEQISSYPAISGNTIVWEVYRSGSYSIVGYDIMQKHDFTITSISSSHRINGLDLDGNLVVWSSHGDIFGYDLQQSRQFIIDQAIGAQTNPRISGHTVVWLDGRNSGVGKYEGDTDIYGARLDPGPAPIPPVIGAPSAVDAKIEIVWPLGKPVSDADKANIGTWLFLPGTLNLAPCQFNPTVTLWKAINNGAAKPVGTGRLEGNYKYINGRAVPTWIFNDVDVSAARDPQNKIYFYTTIGDVPSQTNVWAHGVDARTYFPQQDIPTGVKAATGVVDAKIEIVWPQSNLSVDKAQKVNISASLFSPDTLQSVPQDFNSTVHLFRSLNNGIRQEVAIGQKRLVQQGSFTYPVWDFNDIDVSVANDPANKYYFTLSVDGVITNSNVWSHGADARTYFPQMDTPTQNCG